jgi:hypothetical protein
VYTRLFAPRVGAPEYSIMRVPAASAAIVVVDDVSKFTPVNTVLSTETLLHEVPPFVERQTSISTGPAVLTLPPEY